MEESEDGQDLADGQDWGRKPLPLQRLLQETTAGRPRARGRSAASCELSGSEGKENDSGESCSVVEEEQEWLAAEPLSSTVMDRSCPDSLRPSGTSAIFSTSDNLSSISLLLPRPESTSTSALPRPDLQSSGPGEKLFKTPKRREAGAGQELGLTPASSLTPSSGVSSGRTRSSGSSRTPNSCGRRSIRTPSSSSSGTRWNPFDCGRSYDQLHQPTLSPGVFATVISPSQDTEASTGRFWSIEQQADMFPSEISDESPMKQSLYTRHHSVDVENKTQEQIELYFASHHTVTSPPDLPPTGSLLLDSPANGSYCLGGGGVTTGTQTALTLPPSLPAEVEAVLRQFGLLPDPALREDVPPAALSNSTLRRKLFNGDAGQEDFDSSVNSSSCSASPPYSLVSPCPGVTPGRVIRTPSTAWSSSPVRREGGGRATSFSPPDQMGSPIFSPIVRERLGRGRVGEEMDNSSEELRPPLSPKEGGAEVADMTSGESSLLYQTADSLHCTEEAVQEMETDSASCAGGSHSCVVQEDSNSANNVWTVSHSAREGYGWAASTATDGWTEHTREEASSLQATASLLPDQTHESRVDTGYSTQGGASDYTSLGTSACQQDSALVSQGERSGGVSVINPPSAPPAVDKGVLCSYGVAENCNDISVGFPLGSSTPTKN